MPDYYIRTPEQGESRGPFDPSKLHTLAEAGQIDLDTLYYDEAEEVWQPIADNEELRAQIFPERKKLSLKVDKPEQSQREASPDKAIKVESMLAAAEGDTEEKRKLSRQKKSFERAAKMSAAGLGLMMLLSALFMVLPLVPQFQAAANDGNWMHIFNYPTMLIGTFDLIIGVVLILSVTEAFPLARGRAMLTLGFGLYVGWALGDSLLMALAAAAGAGIFLATIAQSMPALLLAFILGIGGNGYLAYLALNGRFDGFFAHIVLNLITG